MQGYAFVRSETYARSIAKNRKSSRPTLKGVAYEADRLQGYCPDVDASARPGHRLRSGPREPVLLYGMAPSLVPGMAERDIKREKRRLKGSRKQIYKTTHCIQSNVVSTPVTPAAYERDPALRQEVDAFFADAIAYIQDDIQRRGGELVLAVLMCSGS